MSYETIFNKILEQVCIDHNTTLAKFKALFNQARLTNDEADYCDQILDEAETIARIEFDEIRAN